MVFLSLLATEQSATHQSHKPHRQHRTQHYVHAPFLRAQSPALQRRVAASAPVFRVRQKCAHCHKPRVVEGTHLGAPSVLVVLGVVVIGVLRVYKWVKFVILRQPVPLEGDLGVRGEHRREHRSAGQRRRRGRESNAGHQRRCACTASISTQPAHAAAGSVTRPASQDWPRNGSCLLAFPLRSTSSALARSIAGERPQAHARRTAASARSKGEMHQPRRRRPWRGWAFCPRPGVQLSTSPRCLFAICQSLVRGV
jgi:hypothetical protein